MSPATMAARRRGIGSRGGAPNRPDLMSRIWAMARIVPEAANDSVRQTIFPVRPQATILTEGGKQPCMGSTLGYPRKGAHESKSRSPYQGSTGGHELRAWNPVGECRGRHGSILARPFGAIANFAAVDIRLPWPGLGGMRCLG